MLAFRRSCNIGAAVALGDCAQSVFGRVQVTLSDSYVQAMSEVWWLDTNDMCRCLHQGIHKSSVSETGVRFPGTLKPPKISNHMPLHTSKTHEILVLRTVNQTLSSTLSLKAQHIPRIPTDPTTNLSRPTF